MKGANTRKVDKKKSSGISGLWVLKDDGRADSKRRMRGDLKPSQRRYCFQDR